MIAQPDPVNYVVLPASEASSLLLNLEYLPASFHFATKRNLLKRGEQKTQQQMCRKVRG